MEKFYTAVGRTQIRTNQSGNQNPVVICNEKEYILDLPEMILWSVLNWHIVTADEAKLLYESKANELDCSSELGFYTYLQRLLQRGLIAEGNGDTPADALYSLLSNLYIVPISENVFLRATSFLKLTFINKIPYSVTKTIFGKDKRTSDEKKVIKLTKKALLSTAEIIKCVECNFLNFSNAEQLLDTLYNDDTTTSDNIAESTRYLASCKPVLTSIANLYLRRQIIFEGMPR